MLRSGSRYAVEIAAITLVEILLFFPRVAWRTWVLLFRAG